MRLLCSVFSLIIYFKLLGQLETGKEAMDSYCSKEIERKKRRIWQNLGFYWKTKKAAATTNQLQQQKEQHPPTIFVTQYLSLTHTCYKCPWHTLAAEHVARPSLKASSKASLKASFESLNCFFKSLKSLEKSCLFSADWRCWVKAILKSVSFGEARQPNTQALPSSKNIDSQTSLSKQEKKFHHTSALKKLRT